MPGAASSPAHSSSSRNPMRAVLPGKPHTVLHAVDTALWDGLRLVAYISGASLILLRGPNDLLQTISHGDDRHLRGLAIDPLSGKIATTDASQVFIYTPIGRDYGALRWTLQTTYSSDRPHDPISCLSWGLPGELLVSTSHLILLTTDGPIRTIWQSKLLANPAKLGLFSHDASLIASIGHHDRLVKTWRRGFIGGGNERFDPVYIGHPAAVTDMRWRANPPRRGDGEEENTESVLYTTCTDGKLRVWTTVDMHCLQVLQLWTEVDMFSAIQPREPLSPGVGKKRRFVSVLDHWNFDAAVSAAAEQTPTDEREQHTRAHLTELAERCPEVAIIFDDEGNMSAWGLERVACKVRQPNDVVNIANVEGLALRSLKRIKSGQDFMQLNVFCTGADVHMLAHFFDGRLQWHSSPVDRLLDPSPKPESLKLFAELTGHTDSIEKLFTCGSVTVSASHDGEVVVWHKQGSALVRLSTGAVLGKLIDCSFDEEQHILALLVDDALILFDVDHTLLLELARHALPNASNISMLGLPARMGASTITSQFLLIDDQVQVSVLESTRDRGSYQIRDISKPSSGSAWQRTNGLLNGDASHQGRDRAHTHRQLVSGEQLVSFNARNGLETWQFSVDSSQSKMRSSMSLCVEDPGTLCVSAQHVACTNSDSTTLYIWNRATGLLEHSHIFDRFDPVRTVKWSSAGRHGPTFLAIVFAHRAVIWTSSNLGLCEGEPAWIQVKETSISELTNIPIADASWVSSHGLLVAAGNQMFILDLAVSVPQGIADVLQLSKAERSNRSLFKVAKSLGGTLPVYHPLFIRSTLSQGRFKYCSALLRRLDSRLKYFAEGDDFSSSLSLRLESSRRDAALLGIDEGMNKLSLNGDDLDKDHNRLGFTEEDVSALCERICIVPWINENDRSGLKQLVQIATQLDEHQQSVDNFGLQYLSSLFLDGRSEHNGADLSWQAIFQASQSASHDILVDQINRQTNNRLLWPTARRTGLFLWLSDIDALRTRLETLARAEYTKTDERNPIDCTLYYLALRKKSILTNLWRMATWNKEQRATHKMLQNDFNDPRWKTAALKNAYALLGKRRAEYAAGWFLLADDLRGAVGVLATQCEDLRLAITVARAYEGDGGPILKELIEDKVLPISVQWNNRWMAAWAFWLLGRKDAMLRAFIDPLSSLIPNAPAPRREHLIMCADDLSLAHNYQNARDALAADPRASKATIGLSVANEYALVKRCAHMYMRAGLGSLAIDLMRTFSFSRNVGPAPGAVDGTHEPPRPAPAAPVPSALDAFIADEPAAPREAVETSSTAPAASAETPAPATGKKQAVAPSEASILDDFDF